MNKIFYNPETGEVRGFSSGEVTMELPYIESDVVPYLMWNYKVVDGELTTLHSVFTDEQWAMIMETGHL